MTSATTRRLARAVLLAGLALPMTALLPTAAPFAISKAHAEEATTIAQFKSILANYGTWGTSDKYGDIWVPTVTPEGWHPYPPCQWSYTKDGWYFNDNTPWGAIVHHYGRWSHDEKIGWFWVPDEDWSPGWVVWRSSDKWIGWAPMPPKQDFQLVSSDEFNNDKLWIFMDVQKFGNGECGGDGASTNVSFAEAYDGTTWTSLFNLPEGRLVDVIYVPHWTAKVIKELVPIFIPVPGYCPPNTNPPGNNPNTPPGVRVPGPLPVNPRPANGPYPVQPLPQNPYQPATPLQQNPYQPSIPIQQNPYQPAIPIQQNQYIPVPVQQNKYIPVPVQQNKYIPVPVQQNSYVPEPTNQPNPNNPLTPNSRTPTGANFQIQLPNRNGRHPGGVNNSAVGRMVPAEERAVNSMSSGRRAHLSTLNPVSHSTLNVSPVGHSVMNSVAIHPQGLALSHSMGVGMGRGILR
jgi:hypothetical protein